MDICINDLNGEDITGTFFEKKLQKTKQQEFRIEKAIKKKDLVWFYYIKMSSFFPKSYKSKLKLIFQIMQQNETLKIFLMLILRVSHWKQIWLMWKLK